MNVLINASNLKVGGGVQVCDSVCRELYKYTSKHHFTVILPPVLEECAKAIEMLHGIHVVRYSRPLRMIQILTLQYTNTRHDDRQVLMRIIRTNSQ